jgi:hypothetical protein
LSRRADFEALQVKFPKKHKKLDRDMRESLQVCAGEVPTFYTTCSLEA